MAPLYVKQHNQSPPTFVTTNNGEEPESISPSSVFGIIGGWFGLQGPQGVFKLIPMLPTLFSSQYQEPKCEPTSTPSTSPDQCLEVDEVEKEKPNYGDDSDSLEASVTFKSSLVRTTGYLGLTALTLRTPGAKAAKLITAAAAAIFFSYTHKRFLEPWFWSMVLPAGCVAKLFPSFKWASLSSWTNGQCRTVCLRPSASSLAFLFLPALVSQATAAPIPTPPDFNGLQLTLLAYVSPWILHIIFLYTCGHLAYLWRRQMPTDGYNPPKISWMLAVIMAGTWVVIRTTKEDVEAVALASFSSPWAIFMGDSMRSLKSKKNYLMIIVFASGSVCLLLTSFSCSTCTWDEFWHLYATMGPGFLIGTSVLVYFLWPQDDRVLPHRHND